MTGEIILHGRVLPIGGVREKALAAHRAGTKMVILPERNKKDLMDMPKPALKKLRVVLVNMDRVFKMALAPKAVIRPPRPRPAPNEEGRE